MADSPLKLTVRLPFATEAEFIARYGANISLGGIYLRTKALHAPKTMLSLEVKLQNGQVIVRTECEVAWVTGASGKGTPGLGLRFTQLDAGTARLLDSMAAAMPHLRSTEVPLPKGVGEPDASPTAVPAPILSPRSSPPQAADIPLPVAPTPLPLETAAPALPLNPGGPIIGIDLGTTYSCVAFVRDGKPQVIASRAGHRTIPSVVAASNRGDLLVGHLAKNQLLTNPKQTIYGAKRLIGRQYDSEVIQRLKGQFAYEICAGEKGEAAVRLNNCTYSLQQISALILKDLKETAEAQLKEPVQRAVITVPAYYNDLQRNAVREAGRLAGLFVERIVNEPTAAALSYGYGRGLNKRVLVYDLGGGTFDASILELNDTVYEVVSTGGDTFLGGIDFDEAIVKWLSAEFEKTHGKKFAPDRVGLQRVFDAAERAKIQLSDQLTARIHVPFVAMIDQKPFDLTVVLTREKMIELVRPLVERTINVCAEVLNARKLRRTDISDVILVGGMTRATVVREYVDAFFGKPPAKSIHPDEAVATGAALLAHTLATKEGLVLIDVLPMSIGVMLPQGRFKPVIERNAALPATKRYTLATTKDDQRELEVSVFQGEETAASAAEYLGTLKVGPLPKGPKGTVHVTVSFELSNECILKLKAREDVGGTEVEAVFSTQHTPEAARARLDREPADELPTPQLPGGFWNWLRGLFS